MSKAEYGDAARKRRESVRQGARRVASAIAARRRLNAAQPATPKPGGRLPGKSVQ